MQAQAVQNNLEEITGPEHLAISGLAAASKRDAHGALPTQGEDVIHARFGDFSQRFIIILVSILRCS